MRVTITCLLAALYKNLMHWVYKNRWC